MKKKILTTLYKKTSHLQPYQNLLLLKITIDTKNILMSHPVLHPLIFFTTIITGQKDQYMTLEMLYLVVIKSYFHYLNIFYLII